MSKTRRQFIKAAVLGGVAAATYPAAASGEAPAPDGEGAKALDILVLGGTGFIGPHMVREALRRGHRVTLFNRGRTNNALFPDVETIKGDRNGGLEGLRARRWDAVIDNSGYVPRHVRDSARLLAGSTGYYLFISSVSVYADFSRPIDESSPVQTLADESIEEVTGSTYGPLKALCERWGRDAFGADRYAVLRPTYICGPGDHTDRFTYWPVRTLRGGEMLWPGRPSAPLQIIDVRDLASFTVDSVEQRLAGTYNMVTPEGEYTMGGLLADSQAVSGATVEPVWVSEAFIREQNAGANGALPMWHPREDGMAEGLYVSGAAARAAGLHNRPVRETIRDLLAWWKTLPPSRTEKPRAGLSAEREAELLAAWKKDYA
jgi:2'-hydroxyisoflavone reductase